MEPRRTFRMQPPRLYRRVRERIEATGFDGKGRQRCGGSRVHFETGFRVVVRHTGGAPAGGGKSRLCRGAAVGRERPVRGSGRRVSIAVDETLDFLP
jgi:hypothetical protein